MILLFLTKGCRVSSYISGFAKFSEFSERKNSINRNLRLNSWESLFSSTSFGFRTGVNLDPFLVI